MAKDKIKKELTHIQVKDNGLIISNNIGLKLLDLRTMLQNGIITSLISGSDTNSVTRYKIGQNAQFESFKLRANKLIDEARKSVKNALKNDNTVNLTTKQTNRMTKEIDKGMLFLQKSAVQTYRKTLDNVFLKVKTPSELKDQLQKHLNSNLKIGVIYKNEREYKFESYWEMKTRTDIQKEIADNMIKAGDANGVVFYVCAFFGDCAKDHVEYQGKIYHADNWEAIAPKDRIDEIDAYIKEHDVKNVKDVTENKPFLTTRPNCRHYFQYVDIDSVLGAKNEKELSNLRDKMNLNFNGKYQPEKYKALQQQRLNERKIRAEKEQITKNELELHLKPENYKELQTKIKIGEANVRRYQAEQRSLVKQYSNLERSYMRESGRNRVDFGVSGKNFISENEKNKTDRIVSSPKYAVDFNKIKSRSFNDKIFKALDCNLKDKRKLYRDIKDMLSHRSGTNGEDMIMYNLKTHEIRINNTSNVPSRVELTQEDLNFISSDSKNVICIHNHPASLPPSIDDINALYHRKQEKGMVITHSGKVYVYTKPKKEIENKILNNLVDKALGKGYNENELQAFVINKLTEMFDFKFMEVK
jgi:hypothetical protein